VPDTVKERVRVRIPRAEAGGFPAANSVNEVLRPAEDTVPRTRLKPTEHGPNVDDLTSSAIVFGIALAGGGLHIWLESVAKARFRRWAKREGLSVLDVSRPFFRTGPFWWYETRGLALFRFTASDRHGTERQGWALFSPGPWYEEPCQIRWER
jgi:hypothetical protein